MGPMLILFIMFSPTWSCADGWMSVIQLVQAGSSASSGLASVPCGMAPRNVSACIQFWFVISGRAGVDSERDRLW